MWCVHKEYSNKKKCTLTLKIRCINYATKTAFKNQYTLKNAVIFFFTHLLGSACWVVFNIFTHELGCFSGTNFLFLNPNAGFILLGYFTGLFLIFLLPRCWVVFLPNGWAESAG